MSELILYKDEEFIAVNKPAGILSQKDKSGDPDIADLVKKKLQLRDFLAPVHRLDRNTSGILLLARNSSTANEFSTYIKKGALKREYLAITKGDPGESGSYNFRLIKNEEKNIVYVDESGQEAETHFQRIERMGNSSLVKVKIITGRSHQIRIHFSHAGHALIGDPKYAKKPWSELFHRPALHAYELTLPANQKRKELLLRAPVAEDFLTLLTKLGGKSSL